MMGIPNTTRIAKRGINISSEDASGIPAPITCSKSNIFLYYRCYVQFGFNASENFGFIRTFAFQSKKLVAVAPWGISLTRVLSWHFDLRLSATNAEAT